MSERKPRPATYADLLKVPEHKVAEIVDGELVVSPRPASPHAFASSGFGGSLFNPFQRGSGGPGGWWILDEPELHLGPDVLVPDLAGWRQERMPKVSNVAAFALAPNWVCEVVSPSSVRHDRIRKMRVYAREKVAHAWLLDPLARTLEGFRLQGDQWLEVGGFAGDERVRAEPFEAVELELAGLWIAPEPP